MATFEEIQQICNEHINQQSFFAQPEELYQGVTHIIAQKGKRIRPAMLLMACDLFGGNLNDALNPAFAVELFHNSTLVHDDIMDESDLRRGRPTVHKLYGLNNAILSGDVMMYYSYQYLFDTEESKVASVARMFTTAAIQVFEGQQMDLNFENRSDVSEEEYLKMIEYKTAVLIAVSLKLGALIGGASDQDQEAIYEFGRNLGLAFQLKDDYLDVYAEGEKFGKKIGGDIAQNKKTFLLINAYKAANEDQSILMNDILELDDKDEKIRAMTDMYRQLNIREITEKKIEEYYEKCLENLKAIKVDDQVKQPLFQLAENLYFRNF